MKPLNELKKLLLDNPLAGIETRSKFYTVEGTLTSANENKPLSLFITVDQSENFWWTGLYGSYYAVGAPLALGNPFIQITNVLSQDQYFKTMPQNLAIGGAPHPGYASFDGNIAPGAIPDTITNNKLPYLQKPLPFDVVLESQQQLRVDLLAPAGLANSLNVDILFIGLSQRLRR